MCKVKQGYDYPWVYRVVAVMWLLRSGCNLLMNRDSDIMRSRRLECDDNTSKSFEVNG